MPESTKSPAEAGELAEAMRRLAEDAENEAGLGAGMLGGARIAANIRTVLSSLRAQPQAREDTTPSPLGGASVGPDEAEAASPVDATPQVAQQDALGTQDLIRRLEGECCNCGYAGLMAEAADALREQAREDAQPVGLDFLEGWEDQKTPSVSGPVAWRCRNIGGVWSYGEAKQPNFAFCEPLYDHPAPDAVRVAVEALERIENPRSDFDLKNPRSVARQALAALQAAVKGGAA